MTLSIAHVPMVATLPLGVIWSTKQPSSKKQLLRGVSAANYMDKEIKIVKMVFAKQKR